MTAHTYLTRAATMRDVPDLLIAARRFTDGSGLSQRFDLRHAKESLEVLIHGGGLLQVLEADGQVVGFLAATLTQDLFSKESHAAVMGVYAPDDHGEAVGRLVWDFAEWAVQHGAAFGSMVVPDNERGRTMENAGPFKAAGKVLFSEVVPRATRM